MSPTISPSAIPKEASWTATIPPNVTVTLLTERSWALPVDSTAAGTLLTAASYFVPRWSRAPVALGRCWHARVCLMVSRALVGRSLPHHAQHRRSSSPEEAESEDRGDHQERHVDERRVVPPGAILEHGDGTVGGSQMQGVEAATDDQARHDHRQARDDKQVDRHPPAVVLTIDDKNREDDEVGG